MFLLKLQKLHNMKEISEGLLMFKQKRMLSQKQNYLKTCLKINMKPLVELNQKFIIFYYSFISWECCFITIKLKAYVTSYVFIDRYWLLKN